MTAPGFCLREVYRRGPTGTIAAYQLNAELNGRAEPISIVVPQISNEHPDIRNIVQAKRFALIVIVAVGFIATAPIQAETFTFDRHQVVLEPPKGYCALDPGRPSEQATIENQKALQSTYN